MSPVFAQGQTVPKSDYVGNVEVWDVDRICETIKTVAKKYSLPRATFTRLIWTESRFNINAVSPVGAQGIAQFMPGTAEQRGLSDPFDPALALDASASLLADLRTRFGNFGLAAMAYNAGSGRVSRWLAGQSSLPFETQDYISAITGQTADSFRLATARVVDFSLTEGQKFDQSCRGLPVRKSRFRTIATTRNMPWGVQVAGNVSRARATRSWTRIRSKLRVAIGDVEPQLHQLRRLRGMKPRWAVRLGAPSRAKANEVCGKIRNAGGFCVVLKN